jgi:heat shock protein HslJ
VKIRVILLITVLFVQASVFAQQPVVKDKKVYYLSAIYIGGKKNTMARDKGHIVFNTRAKTSTCFTSCNFIQMKYVMKDHNLKFTSIIPAKDPCPDALVGLESDFKENLPRVSNYLVKDKQLILLDKKDTLMVFYETATD